MGEKEPKEKRINARRHMMGEILKIIGLAMLFAWFIWLMEIIMIYC